jgi:hypothetical protein
MTSIVIPYKLGPHNGAELRYALRSFCNLTFPHNVMIVGDKPCWLQNVYHMQSPTQNSRDFMVFLDTHRKMFIAANSEQVSESFIVSYDDIYFLRPTSIKDIAHPRAMIDIAKNPHWQEGAASRGASRKWISLVDKVIAIMKSKNRPTFNWETHLPRLVEKKLVKELIEEHNMLNEPYNFFSLYMNSFIDDKPQLIHPDGGGFKMGVYSPTSKAKLYEMMEKNHVLNHAADCFTESMMQFLSEIFPNKSKYEC